MRLAVARLCAHPRLSNGVAPRLAGCHDWPVIRCLAILCPVDSMAGDLIPELRSNGIA